MTLSLDQLRAAFKQDTNNGPSRPNNYYPFWNIPDGSQAIVRYLPDANKDNPLGFLVEKLMHTLYINGEKKSVPCLRMYDEDCPICKVSQAYYKDGDRENGKKFWRKKQHIGQVIVVEDPLPADTNTGENHEGKVRFVAIGFQVYNIIKDAFESGELDEVPFAFDGGTNFIIKKTRQGDYSNYSLSKFARRSTDLTEDEKALALDESIDLSTLLPQNPGLEKVERMLEAALTGGSLEESSNDSPSRSSRDDDDDLPFEPNDGKGKKGASKAAASKPKSEPAEEPSGDDDYDDEADRILKQIRERQAKKG